jgi:replicative DNA helicase
VPVSVTEIASRGEEFERTPPHDIAAEQCVLGSMLISKDAISDVIEVIRPQDHYRPAHQIVHEAILDLYSRGEPADAITVKDELAKHGTLTRMGGPPYLHTLISSVPTAANAGYYARIVRERAILRRLVEVGTRIVQLGYAGQGDADDVVDQAQAEVYGVTERRASEDYLSLSEIMPGALDEIEAISSRGGGMVGVPTGFVDLDSLTNGLHPGQMIVIAARPAIGKALALGTPLPAPDGWTTMGQVAVGDQLIGVDGKPATVVAATEVMRGRPCYEVEFSDGEVIIADAQHQWVTWTRAARRDDAQLRGLGRNYAEPVLPGLVTTEEIAATLLCRTADRRANHAVALTAPLDLPESELPVPPYALGIWLGDGTTASAQFTSADLEIAMRVAATGLDVTPHDTRGRYGMAFRAPGAQVAERTCVVCGSSFKPKNARVRTCGRSCGGRARFCSAPIAPPRCSRCGTQIAAQLPGTGFCRWCWKKHGTLQAALRTLGVLGNKHIPGRYLRASERQRRDLLAGILDTDGTVTSSGSIQLAVTSRSLAEDARELVLSLGYKASMTTKTVPGRTADSSVCYMVNFTTEDQVFRLNRKNLLQRERLQSEPRRPRWRYIVDVREVDSQPVRCVQVDNPDGMYLAGRSMIPTHNSTLALDLARAAAIRNGLATVIFSLEMSRNEITMKLLSAESRVPLHTMRTGQMNDDDWTRLARRMSEVAEAPLFIDDSPNMSMMEIRAKCRRLKQRHDLRMVIVDYLQLMTSPKRVENRQQEVSEMSRMLKLLAKELDVPVIAISQLNRSPEQRNDKRPLLSDLRESGCVTADTRILRADTGTEVTLGELLESGERDVPVWSLDERLRLVARPMTHAFPSGVKEVFKVRLTSGREVHATASHPFLSYDGWRPLAELEAGSRVAVPRHLPDPLVTRATPEPEIIMLAHLIGDGSFVRNQPIRYASVDEANLAAVTEAAKHFGITAVRDDHEAARCTSLRLPAPHHLTPGKRDPIAEWLDGLGLFGLYSHEKFIPPFVFLLPRQQLALFLRHLWATDGCVWWDTRAWMARICYASTSRRLVDELAQLLLRFNVMTRIKETRAGYRPCYQLVVYGSENQLRFFSEIGVHGERALMAEMTKLVLGTTQGNTNVDTVPREVWNRVREILAERRMSHRQFAAAMGTQFCGSTVGRHSPSSARLSRVAAVLDDADLEMVATNDVFWDEIASVESIGEQPVYDATVLKSHNFIANGVSLHNSIEQDSDLVILLHREDAYERESPRAGEADLIVAKHRNGPTATVTVAFQGHYSRFVDMAPG